MGTELESFSEAMRTFATAAIVMLLANGRASAQFRGPGAPPIPTSSAPSTETGNPAVGTPGTPPSPPGAPGSSNPTAGGRIAQTAAAGRAADRASVRSRVNDHLGRPAVRAAATRD